LVKILSIPERIKLFKEINKIHKEMYGWKMLYENAWGGDYIDIESDVRFDYHDEWVPIDKSDACKYYFNDTKGKDIASLLGTFAWQAYYFYHLNPYRFLELGKNKLADEDFILNGLGKRIRPDVDHPVTCLETIIEVQQRKEDGKIWISSNWLHDPDCYAAALAFGEEISKTFRVAAKEDGKIFDRLWEKYIEINDANKYEFRRALERYFKGEKMSCKNWDSAYVLTASRPWKIKNREQLNEALEIEHKNFHRVLEEFIQWLRDGGLNLGEKAEESLRGGISKLYASYPYDLVKSFGECLIEEDKAQQSDVYLWWGGEPTNDNCYALLTLYFEVDPNDISTPRFNEKVSRNLRVIIDIAERERYNLVSHREYEPKVWNVVFS